MRRAPGVSDTFKPEKSVWTEADLEAMGWHDATIHAIALPTDAFELVLDIDYIVKWVNPAEGQTHFRFWVSPATVVFRNLHELSVSLEPHQQVTIQGIERCDPGKPKNAEYIGRDVEWRWMIECHQGEITFRASGFSQYLRAAPQFGTSQFISVKERGGYSFDRPEEWLRRDV
jgi:hypothetical protein